MTEVNKIGASISTSVSVGDSALVGLINTGTQKIEGNLTIAQTKNHYDSSGKLTKCTIAYKKFSTVIPPIFAERKTELELMQTALAAKTSLGAKIAILVGMTGTGKSTLARKYVNEEIDGKKRTYNSLVWINAEKEVDIIEDLEAIIAFVSDESTKERLRNEPSYLYQILEPPMLIVFDNVEDAGVTKYLLATNTLSSDTEILITTRRDDGWWSELVQPQNVVRIGLLEPKSCEEYIRAKLANCVIGDMEEGCRALGEYFGHLVIAMDAVTSAIAHADEVNRRKTKNPLLIIEWMEIGKNNQKSKDPMDEMYRRLERVWISNIETLRQEPCGELAVAILNSMAYFSPTGVPTLWYYKVLCKPLVKNSEDEVDVALDLLKRWSLVDWRDCKLIAHRLLQATVLKKVRPAEGALMDWLLPAIQKLHGELGVGLTFEFFVVNLMSVLDRLQEGATVTPSLVSFHVYFASRAFDRCHKYLIQLADGISSGSRQVEFQIVDQLVTCGWNGVVERLVSVYAEEYLNNAKASFTSLCGAVNKFSRDQLIFTFENCRKFVHLLPQVYEKADEDNGLENFELGVLVGPVDVVLWAVWCHRKKFSIEEATSLTMDRLGQVLRMLLRYPKLLSQPAEALASLLKAAMVWSWLRDLFEAPAQELQSLIGATFDLDSDQVTKFYSLLQPHNESQDQIALKSNLLAAVCKVVRLCSNNCASCAVIETFVICDSESFQQNFPECVLPLSVLYYCFVSHAKMLKSPTYRQPSKMKFFAMQTRYCTEKYLPKNSLNNFFPDIDKVFSWTKTPSWGHVNSAELFSSDVVPVAGYNDDQVFDVFFQVLRSIRRDKENCLRFLRTVSEGAVLEYNASKHTQDFKCQCIHTEYQLVYAGEIRRSGRLREALDLAANVISHRLHCSPYKAVFGFDFVLETWRDYCNNDSRRELEQTVGKLLVQLIEIYDEKCVSDVQDSGSFCFKESRATFLNFIGATDEAVDLIFEMMTKYPDVLAMHIRFFDKIGGLDGFF